MKYTHLLFLSLFLIVLSCKSNNKTETIIEKTKLYKFSDLAKPDTFKIDLTGNKSEDMNIVFTITNSDGILIYKESIKPTQLLKNFLSGEDLKKESDKISFLNNYINDFFDEEHFLEPAVIADQQADNNAPDKAFFNELKQNQLNGFYYSLGKDKSIYIAWFTKEQKVKIYYQCC